MGCILNVFGVGVELNKVRGIEVDSMKLSLPKRCQKLRAQDQRRADLDKSVGAPFLKLYMEGCAQVSCNSLIIIKCSALWFEYVRIQVRREVLPLARSSLPSLHEAIIVRS